MSLLLTAIALGGGVRRFETLAFSLVLATLTTAAFMVAKKLSTNN